VRELSRPDQLIDATLDLCVRCGYERTTLEQIAAAAEVTPQEFMRDFETKDAALMAVIDVLLEAAAAALSHVDVAASPEHALLAAHTEVVLAITDGRGVVTRDRFIAIAQIFSAHPSLRKQASLARKRILTPALADRMGVAAEDRRVHQAVTVWSAIAGSAYLDGQGVAANFERDDHLGRRMIAELDATFAEIMGGGPE
jgi:AcrR family transcriptional regulator